MAIIHKSGNLFDSDAPLLGHGCNTMGKMGRGIAVEFKKRFPEMYKQYEFICKNKAFEPGTTWLYESEIAGEPWVANIATQETYYGDHPATLENVLTALVDLRSLMLVYNLDYIALPRIGAGLGGLKWEEVYPIIENELSDIDKVEIWTLP